MVYPNRLATQLNNSHQMSNFVDDEGKGWFQENKDQMRNFTQQQVKEVLIKENLRPVKHFNEKRLLTC
jgi:hypothetical protein